MGKQYLFISQSTENDSFCDFSPLLMFAWFDLNYQKIKYINTYPYVRRFSSVMSPASLCPPSIWWPGWRHLCSWQLCRSPRTCHSPNTWLLTTIDLSNYKCLLEALDFCIKEYHFTALITALFHSRYEMVGPSAESCCTQYWLLPASPAGPFSPWHSWWWRQPTQ